MIREYFRGEEWNCRWLEDPIRLVAGLPALGFLELFTWSVKSLATQCPSDSHLLENNLLALLRSCDGEPAPERVFPTIFPAELIAPGIPKEDLETFPLEGSVPVGEVFAVEDPERGSETAG